jgi:hypothetical protein
LSTAETTTAKGKEKAVPWLLQATSTKTNQGDEINEPKIETDDLHCRLNTNQKTQK